MFACSNTRDAHLISILGTDLSYQYREFSDRQVKGGGVM